VALTGGSGTAAAANITVSGGAVTSLALTNGGTYYAIGDVLSALTANIGGTGSGFTFTINNVTGTDGLNFYDTDLKLQKIYNGVTTNLSALWGYRGVTTTYSITKTDYTIDCTGGGTFTVTLPTAVGGAGRQYVITNSGAGTITLGTTSSQTFVNFTGTPTTLTITGLGTRVVQSNGANWLLISSL
jgi:phage-related protein